MRPTQTVYRTHSTEVTVGMRLDMNSALPANARGSSRYKRGIAWHAVPLAHLTQGNCQCCHCVSGLPGAEPGEPLANPVDQRALRSGKREKRRAVFYYIFECAADDPGRVHEDLATISRRVRWPHIRLNERARDGVKPGEAFRAITLPQLLEASVDSVPHIIRQLREKL